MTGTSRALKRLGVTGLSAAIATIGLVPLTATNAFAAIGPTTHVALDKHTDTASVGQASGTEGTCNAFTATIDASSTVTVQIAEPLGRSSQGTHFMGFCQPSNPAHGQTTDAGTALQTPGTPGQNTLIDANGNCETKADANLTPAPTSATAPATYGVSCYATFTDDNANGGIAGDGKVVFGVFSTDAGTMSIDAFGDTNANGVHDQGETAGDTATKTWVATDQNNTADKISCTPPTATNPVNGTHVITCIVTNSAGVAIPDATNVKYIISSGPDSGPNFNSNPTDCDVTGNNDANNGTQTFGGPGGAAETNAAGETVCVLNNNGQPGTDSVTVYLEQNGQTGLQVNSPETQTTVQKTWVQAAPNGALIQVTCSPNQIQAPTAGNGQNSVCQLPLSQTTTTITAHVTNGTNPVTNVSGVIVNFTVGGAGNDPNDTETVSPTSCTTGSDGTCTTTLTDTVPTEGEQLTVTGSTTTQGGPTVNSTATIKYHNPTRAEARNIAITPGTTAQPAGGAQTLVAKVTDRFNNPVANVCVGWNETGPGRFSNTSLSACVYNIVNSNNYQAACITGADGTCSQEVTSLTSESGPETVTAQIDFSSTNNTQNNYPDAQHIECQAPAGQTFASAGASKTTPDTTTVPSAPAGTCSATATVTWQGSGGGGNGAVIITTATDNVPAGSPVTITGTSPANATVTLNGFDWHNGNHVVGNATADAAGNWTFTTSAIFYNTTVTANVTGLAASNTKTVGVTQTFSGVHFNKIGVVRGFSEYNVDGVSSSYVPDEPIRVQNGACRSQLCGITHIRAVNGIAHFDRLHIYLKPGTYTFTLFGSGGSPATGHQYLNPGRMQFTVTIH